MIYRGLAQMSVDGQRATGASRKVAVARRDRRLWNTVKSASSYCIPDQFVTYLVGLWLPKGTK